MPEKQWIREFLLTQNQPVSVVDFGVNILIAALLAFVLAWTYRHYGRSLNNRVIFSRNFVVLTVTTMLVITIVKSSLALSLGLVGALSIVRFRAAIKDPEELVFLFICIAVGLGLGANLRLITLSGATLILIILVGRGLFFSEKEAANFFLTLSLQGSQSGITDKISNILKKLCTFVEMKRLDETNDGLEFTFSVEVNSLESLEKIRCEIRNLAQQVRMTFVDNKGMVW